MRLSSIDRLVDSQEAVTAIEYALLAGLIAVMIVGSVGLLGAKTLDFWNFVSERVAFAVLDDHS